MTRTSAKIDIRTMRLNTNRENQPRRMDIKRFIFFSVNGFNFMVFYSNRTLGSTMATQMSDKMFPTRKRTEEMTSTPKTTG